MTELSDRAELRARVGLSMVAAPGDPVAGALLERDGAADLLAAITGAAPLDPPPGADPAAFTTKERAWRRRAAGVTPSAAAEVVRRTSEIGARLVAPDSPEWPTQLDSLAECRPYVLWVRGSGDLRNACLRSVGVVGARAATDYGLHVAGELGYGLAERGWVPVSGGAYGIDGAAHRGAVVAGAPTVVVLACGVDLDYPQGHERLFADVTSRGVLIGEVPPGYRPTKHGFLVRNRLIAALTPGTVVVEAAQRSGAINTARHTSELNRVLMAVPGPVTSALSAGCHMLLRDWQAVCVTDAADIIEQVGDIGADLAPAERAPRLYPADLDEAAQRVLSAVPSRGGAGPATVAAAVGCDIDTALRQLGLLAATGFVERADEGWRRLGQ